MGYWLTWSCTVLLGCCDVCNWTAMPDKCCLALMSPPGFYELFLEARTSEVIHEHQGKRCDPNDSSRPEHSYCLHVAWFLLYFWAGSLTGSSLVRLGWLASKLPASAIHTYPGTTSVSNCVWLFTWMLRIQACLASTFLSSFSTPYNINKCTTFQLFVFTVICLNVDLFSFIFPFYTCL